MNVSYWKYESKKFRGWCLNNCGNEIGRQRTKYCSRRCRSIQQYSAKVEQLEAGLYPPVKNARAFLWRFLLERYGEKCSACGWAERHPSTGRVPLEIEHIDGNWTNNTLENLTLLCPNCHSLTPTFRGLNRGRGRANRLGGRQNPIKSAEGQNASNGQNDAAR